MKIIHWAIIFLVIVIPFSIVCRTTIQKKTLVLHDQTRINNAIDNATYDAVNQIVEVSEELGFGKNIPITKGVAEATINRFFETLAVNFNIPSREDIAKNYFSQYVPAILIIGYDGIYVCSFDLSSDGYEYVIKPKIPYAYTSPDGQAIINFTLGNDIKIYIPDKEIYLDGYVENLSDMDADDVKFLDAEINNTDDIGYYLNTLPVLTSNLSFIFDRMKEHTTLTMPEFLYADKVAQDYVFNESNEIVEDASEFHKLRRKTIVDLITSVLKYEINEHNTYADLIGVDYNFYIPDINREEWNNTIDDISVLAFFQGMPMGTDSYYNNYALGGAKIVDPQYYYHVSDDPTHYHKKSCDWVPKDSNGNVDLDGVSHIYLTARDARRDDRWACKYCR